MVNRFVFYQNPPEGEHVIMKILVVNAGSSSLKYQLFDMDENKVLAKGLCEQIGPAGNITHKRPGQPTYAENYPMPTHNEAIELVLKLLTDAEWGVIKSVDEIGAVGHRFAHGGKFHSVYKMMIDTLCVGRTNITDANNTYLDFYHII